MLGSMKHTRGVDGESQTWDHGHWEACRHRSTPGETLGSSIGKVNKGPTPGERPQCRSQTWRPHARSKASVTACCTSRVSQGKLTWHAKCAIQDTGGAVSDTAEAASWGQAMHGTLLKLHQVHLCDEDSQHDKNTRDNVLKAHRGIIEGACVSDDIKNSSRCSWVEHTIECANRDAWAGRWFEQVEGTENTVKVELDSCQTGVEMHAHIDEVSWTDIFPNTHEPLATNLWKTLLDSALVGTLARTPKILASRPTQPVTEPSEDYLLSI